MPMHRRTNFAGWLTYSPPAAGQVLAAMISTHAHQLIQLLVNAQLISGHEVGCAELVCMFTYGVSYPDPDFPNDFDVALWMSGDEQELPAFLLLRQHRYSHALSVHIPAGWPTPQHWDGGDDLGVNANCPQGALWTHHRFLQRCNTASMTVVQAIVDHAMAHGEWTPWSPGVTITDADD